MKHPWVTLALLCTLAAGCGTTKWTDSKRTATEQLLVTDSIDRAVSALDFRALAGKPVFLDTAPLATALDAEYLTSSLRQHMLASGCILKEKKEDADYVVEARAGAVGTDHHDVLFGVPSVSVPAGVTLSNVPSSIPEIPLVKKTEQRAVTKVGIFAYNRRTGRPVWQSGEVLAWSRAKDIWVFGAGPFQRGTIYNGTRFAGDKVSIPLINLADEEDRDKKVSVADEAYFVEPPQEEIQTAKKPDANSAAAQGAKPPATPAGNGPSAVVATALAEPAAPADGQAPGAKPGAEKPAGDKPAPEKPPPASAAGDKSGGDNPPAPLPLGPAGILLPEESGPGEDILPWWENDPPPRLRLSPPALP